MTDETDLLTRGRGIVAKLWGARAGGQELAALGRRDELRAHVAGALNLGITREELIEVLMQTACYAGVPAAVNALNAAADVLSPR